MSRQARQYCESGIYHVMMRGSSHQPIFASDDDKRLAVGLLQKKTAEAECKIYAYCVLDNHLHILIRGEGVGLSTAIKKFGISYASYYNSTYNKIGHVFQDRFRSECISNDAHLVTVLRYIHFNPEKAKICKMEDYPWSSYPSYLEGKHSDGMRELLEYFAPEYKKALDNFRLFHQEVIAEDAVSAKIKEVDYDMAGRVLAENIKLLRRIAAGDKIDKNELKPLLKELHEEAGLSLRQIAVRTGLNRELVRKLGAK